MILKVLKKSDTYRDLLMKNIGADDFLQSFDSGLQDELDKLVQVVTTKIKNAGQGKTPCCSLASILLAYALQSKPCQTSLLQARNLEQVGRNILFCLEQSVKIAKKNFTSLMNTYTAHYCKQVDRPELMELFVLMAELIGGECYPLKTRWFTCS